MGVVAFVLLACALVLVAGVEWPRVSAKVGSDARAGRKRARRKEALTVIEGMGHDLPRELWPDIVEAISANAARAGSPFHQHA